jgi:hypothetical protein
MSFAHKPVTNLTYSLPELFHGWFRCDPYIWCIYLNRNVLRESLIQNLFTYGHEDIIFSPVELFSKPCYFQARPKTAGEDIKGLHLQ